MNRNTLIPLVLFATFVLLAVPALAGSHSKGSCDWTKTSKAAPVASSWKAGLDDRLFAESGRYLQWRDELKLNDEQVARIKEIKRAVTKQLIMKKAEIKAIQVDIHAQLEQHPLNAETLQGYYDQKHQRKQNYTAALVGLYGQLRGVLTAEQQAAFQKLSDKSGRICPYAGLS